MAGKQLTHLPTRKVGMLTPFISLTSSQRHFIIPHHHHEKKKSGYNPTRYFVCERPYSPNFDYSILLQLFYFIISSYKSLTLCLIYKLHFIRGMYVYNKTWYIYKFSTICGFRHSLEILEHIPQISGDYHMLHLQILSVYFTL